MDQKRVINGIEVYAGANLKGVKFKTDKLNLRDMNLEGINFEGADLNHADFGGSNLRHANFKKANLKGARFASVYWGDTGGNVNVTLYQKPGSENTDVSYADFTEANMSGYVRLERAKAVGTKFNKAKMTDFLGDGTNFNKADFSGADMYMSHMYRSDFIESNLSGVDLTYADLSDADLTDANLSKAKLNSRTNLSHAILDGTILDGTKLGGVDYSKALYDSSSFQDPRCPKGYEYVKGYSYRGVRVKPYCRKKGTKFSSSERIPPLF